jgi:transcriptional regulator with XRE-family HTH domain
MNHHLDIRCGEKIIQLNILSKMKTKLDIIDALKRARKNQGLTQEDLAARAGTSRITVGRVEAGFDPKLATVHELARALGLELTLVPQALAGEVQAFIRSGGRLLGQPSGAAAPPSVVEQAAAATAPLREAGAQARTAGARPGARSMGSDLTARSAVSEPSPVWSARSVAEAASTGGGGAQAVWPARNAARAAAGGPTLSPAALAKLQKTRNAGNPSGSGA